jgi:hypothetical protein
LVNYADYDQIQNGNDPFLDEIKLKNIVRVFLTTSDEKKAATKSGVKSCDVLIDEIDAASN